mgnify:CR=1 FL=1
MKKICIPITAIPHLARQKLLIEELKKHFEVDLFQPKQINKSMEISALFYATEFNNYLANKNYDAVIIRGDRYEMLGLAMVAAYKGLKIIHIEGGDLSGVIDNKVRHAITHLSDYHFCTNEESHRRLINMGVPINKVWNYGSLDVEFASKVKFRRLKKGPYLLVIYHPIENEDENEIEKTLINFKKYTIIKIGSNMDYGRKYGEEEYSPEDYINLMRGAKCCIGNSSSLLKEASVLKVSVVNIGDRQYKRLKPKNVLTVPCKSDRIKLGIDFQLKNKYNIDKIYYQKNTSKKIVKKLKGLL